MHINYKEVCAIANTVARWAQRWAGQTVVVHTDSTVIKATLLNKGRSNHAYINNVLWLICWKEVAYDSQLHAIHIQVVSIAFQMLFPRAQSKRKTSMLTLILAPRLSATIPHHGTHVAIIIPFSVSTGAAVKLVKDLKTEVTSSQAVSYTHLTLPTIPRV